MGILKVEHLTKKFGGLTAVNDFSFDMQPRTIHALIGPNGSGKTTTINMLNGVFPATSGKITFEGQEITGMATYKIARLGVARTFQNTAVRRFVYPARWNIVSSISNTSRSSSTSSIL